MKRVVSPGKDVRFCSVSQSNAAGEDIKVYGEDRVLGVLGIM